MSARSKRKPSSAPEKNVRKNPRKTSSLGLISWPANSSALIYQLLCEVERPENFKVLFWRKGKLCVVCMCCAHVLAHRSGETKISV